MKTRQYTKGFIKAVIVALQAVIDQDAPSCGAPYPLGYRPAYYYGGDNKRSIVGQLIHKKHYKTKFEGHPPSNLEVLAAVGFSRGEALNPDDQWLLCLIEDCHDLGNDQVYCNGGDFVERMLDAIASHIKELPSQFEELI